MLQRPFKAVIRTAFHEWAASKLDAQFQEAGVCDFLDSFKMKNIKPLALQWCITSWRQLSERKSLILEGWRQCCTSLYDVHNRDKRVAALTEVAQRKLEEKHVPEGNEEAEQCESDLEIESLTSDSDNDEIADIQSTDDNKDELDVTATIPEPARRSTRRRRLSSQRGSYMLSSQHIAMTEDSDV